MTRLPEEECAFYFAALGQIEPEQRLEFMARVTGFLDALSPRCDPGPGDIDRAIRQAFEALWTPPPALEPRTVGRWARNAPRYERVSKGAVAEG